MPARSSSALLPNPVRTYSVSLSLAQHAWKYSIYTMEVTTRVRGGYSSFGVGARHRRRVPRRRDATVSYARRGVPKHGSFVSPACPFPLLSLPSSLSLSSSLSPIRVSRCRSRRRRRRLSVARRATGASASAPGAAVQVRIESESRVTGLSAVPAAESGATKFRSFPARVRGNAFGIYVSFAG